MIKSAWGGKRKTAKYLIKRSTFAFLRSICGGHKSPKDYADVDKSKQFSGANDENGLVRVKAAREFSPANVAIVLNTPATSKLARE